MPAKTSRKPRLAIDMDEVLADPISKFIKLYNRDFGTPADLEIMPGNEVFEHMPGHAQHKWFEYVNEKGFFRDLPLIRDSREVVQELNRRYEVFVVSAAMEFRNSLEDKYDWLAEHFDFIDWQHIIFCGQKIVNADIMIDDRAKNFTGFGGRKLLFTSPHNLLITTHERVNNWMEVAQKLL